MSEHTRMIPFSPLDISEAEINEVAEALRLFDVGKGDEMMVA